MVTQTNRFKAAVAGAPVANMISAYGGIRWGTGLPRQFQYEQHAEPHRRHARGRIRMRYIENSPIFMADRVQTPLLMIHNDQDDAVPWYQGIEYYPGAAAAGQGSLPVQLQRRAARAAPAAPNQKDYTVRMQQFFDHYLKGAARTGVDGEGRTLHRQGQRPPDTAARGNADGDGAQ